MEIHEAAALRSKITLVIDENLLVLKSAMESYGFKVLSFRQGLQDPEIIPNLTGRAILTANSKDFLIDAVVHDFDVIAVENIKFIDDDKTRKNGTASKIASAIRESGLMTIRGNYLLTVLDDGKWKIKELL